MTDRLLYPCGVDLIGEALRSRARDSRVFPYVMSQTYLLAPKYSLRIVVRPAVAFRIDTVHAIGPCELISIQYLNVEFCQHIKQGAQRWAYVNKVVEPAQQCEVVIRCIPELFMLPVEGEENCTVFTSGQEFLVHEEPTDDLSRHRPSVQSLLDEAAKEPSE
jgi:hypothetical protein